jgi:hypothetical protein
MADNTIRIRTTPNGGDKYLKVKLEQDFDFIEILSLKIGQEDAYRNFCSDYGVVAGRVIINSGFGVPNARVSIFIPIDDVDIDDPNIKGLYPYQVTSDKDSDGIRYNLLPKTSETDNDCFTPIGTFPTKREILDNTDMLDVYCKYYKFTTTTNYAGDFMIFGVPLGTYVVHVDADISDIGIASQRPYDSISQGTPKKFFDSPTKYLGGTNLDKLIQVKSANAGVNVQPFWGNTDTCEIGISRVDIDLNYTIKPCAIFMGNIFGDQDKDSVNKRCRPRRDMGNLCNQVSNEGTIEMIRETIDGTIEKFDIEGGRVIDENGSWAYQVPMNLDYMVTDENGDLALSDDPNKGLPTRASVRFKISMDQTGGEGRLRTRAKYLVPHNPTTGVPAEIDYEFGEKTKKTSFRNLYWNKIYSVSNFISRYQQIGPSGGSHTRNITGVKDVDNCVGDKTPFPYNRVNTSFTPIFFIICLIIKILGFLIYVFNSLIIPIINIVLSVVNILIRAWNSLMRPLCRASRRRILRVRIFGFLGFTCRLIIDEIKYVPCIYVKCPNDGENNIFAPGCKRGGLDSGKAWDSLADNAGPPTYYDGDNFGHGGFADLCGLDDCIAFEMAASMNLFQFDFYNDWVNGSLYSFLLKYKKKRKKIEKFCEYDCGDFGIAQGGVDGNGDGSPDNACRTNFLVDVCYKGGGKDQQFDKRDSGGIREGLIKKYNNEFFYAASTHDARAKMFATDIVNLGAVFNCDWQGVPKVQPYLIPSTYKIPPHIQEVKDDYQTVLVSGQCDIDGNTVGVFFSINCLGLHVNSTQCLNIRHICEFGVELDEDRQPTGPAIDGIIGLADLDLDDEDRPKWFRDVFLGLNSTTNSWNLTLPYTSNFNLNNAGVYNFVSTTENGPDYVRFRGYYPSTDTSWAQPNHSYYFYFGILPGKTALDKMNQSFFTTCQPKIVAEFNITTTTTTPPFGVTNGGSVTFTFASGTGPFTYVISGPNGYNNTGTVGAGNSTPTGTVGNLSVGTYTITGTDANGNVVTQTFNISPAPALYANAYVSSNCTTAALPNGSITIASIGGGFTGSTGQYDYTLYSSSCGVVSGPVTFTSVPLVINNLPVDVGPNTCFTPSGNGYTIVVTDAGTGTLVIPDLIVNGATAINVIPTKVDVLCYGGNTGGLSLAVTGGQQPYQISTTSIGYNGNGINISGLTAGTYVTTVTDSLGTIGQATTTINELNPFMEITAETLAILKKQCFPNQHTIPLYVTSPWAAGASVYLDYTVGDEDSEGNPIWIQYPTVFTYTNATTPLIITIPAGVITSTINFRMANAARTCFSEEIEIAVEEIMLPPSLLTVNTTGVVNTKQCVQGQVKFKFNISHLAVGFTERAPYTVTYTVRGIRGTANLTSSVQTTIVTTNQQEITASVPYPGGLVPTSCVITVNVTDNVGCIAPTFILPAITLPTSPVAAAWTNVTYYNAAAGQNWIHKRLGASGGIGTKTGSPYVIYNGTALTEFNFPLGSTLTSTVTDTVGCTVIANG